MQRHPFSGTDAFHLEDGGRWAGEGEGVPAREDSTGEPQRGGSQVGWRAIKVSAKWVLHGVVLLFLGLFQVPSRWQLTSFFHCLF